MKRLAASITIALITSMSTLSSQALAASANLYLGRSAASVTAGSYITVSVYENSGSEPVNAVQANFSYAPTQLQFISISNSSAFSVVAQNSGGGGAVAIARGALPAVSGNQLVASVLFKALVSSGTASLAITGGSSVVSANSNANIMSSSAGTSFALVAPAPPPPPAPKDTTPPTISQVAVTSVTATSAVVTWTTSEPASSEVDYGLTTGYGLAATDGKLVTSHSMPLQSPMVIAGTTYHFIVKSADQAGNGAASSDSTFMTTGLSLLVTLQNAKTGKPIAGATITTDRGAVTTNEQGQATLTNLPNGTLTLTIIMNGRVSTETVAVAATGGKPQSATFKLASTSTALTPLLWLIPAGILMLAAAAGLSWRFFHRQHLTRHSLTAGPLPITARQPFGAPTVGAVITPGKPTQPMEPTVRNDIVR